jgi:anti-sigma factor RsiW
MTDDERLALIHAEIDGELDGAQRGELARLLLAEPQTRVLRDQLKRVGDAVEGIAEAEPPSQLKDAILKRLPLAAAAAAPAPRQWSPARWRQAALFAGLLAAGSIVYETVQGPGAGSGETAGTMAAGAPVALDSVTLGAGPVAGRVSLYRGPGGLTVALDVTAAEPVDLLIASAGHTLRINGLGGGRPVSTSHRTVPLPGVRAGQNVELTFLANQQPVSHATLRAPAAH